MPETCIWCERCVGCPCITDPIEVRRALAEQARRHREAVALAKASRRLDRHRRAA